ncbi:KdsC family phosphatase [Chroogloeocystis siderophila]|jgi:3-deoxy-D-manno-octulosonate 8-phosphate phosphatase (KDO 8-P phosphatase)|uniref:HAD family hydrolase n=1 Tax=Chroogloeocystis siderophila 5.2 s.c.1 TaxID=247279 RepID=A0A1U7HBW7_9CHRO|nr:HAD-IIIA family hydrolase [Chroogloeocystis siderophila]OKH21025.1 HAD family hydrolase [Chroogloeocystis siderophila 5.2 s.c.1]
MTNLSEDLRSRLSQVKLLALDVDGVLTDGGLYYTESGEVFRKFNIKDGQGIKLLQQAGIEVAIITAKSSLSTLNRAKDLKIPHIFLGVKNKLSVLNNLCKELGFAFSQVAYVGDDVNDLDVMQVVGCPMTVADAMKANQACALYITQLPGGQGAVREICEMLIANALVS